MSKSRMRVSSDKGKTWKWRWVNRMERNPIYSDIDEGEWVQVGEKIHEVIIKDGKIEASLLKREEEQT